MLLLSACKDAGIAPAVKEFPVGSDEPVWISKNFGGGRQCDPNDDYRPPDTRRLLEAAGVTVLRTYTGLHPVCAACGCPSYSATQYA